LLYKEVLDQINTSTTMRTTGNSLQWECFKSPGSTDSGGCGKQAEAGRGVKPVDGGSGKVNPGT